MKIPSSCTTPGCYCTSKAANLFCQLSRMSEPDRSTACQTCMTGGKSTGLYVLFFLANRYMVSQEGDHARESHSFDSNEQSSHTNNNAMNCELFTNCFAGLYKEGAGRRYTMWVRSDYTGGPISM
ncbi:hypothetical protein T07_280 [Trichinella nelsoni]|uniref:Uncharacterized protein n=1 Tax=Trichinella nelsoni TaxID=6336 RepID=A0A0V0RIC2_9BILA|nr:hypothetical protein T07_280 [Trichinella nelsoni]